MIKHKNSFLYTTQENIALFIFSFKYVLICSAGVEESLLKDLREFADNSELFKQVGIRNIS